MNKITQSLPLNQVNAYLSDALAMRVGIPQRSGRLAWHAFDNDYLAMVSANAFWNPKTEKFVVPTYSDLFEVDFALDSAGFVAMKMFQEKGIQKGIAGVFPWSYSDYIGLASELNPSWYSQLDMCCEPEIASNQQEIDYRVNATATMLEGMLQICYAWQSELVKSVSANVAANMIKPPVPIIQGWNKSDYLRSLALLQTVWQRWEPWVAPPALIGVGSVCRRDLHHPEHGLFAILDAIVPNLPPNTRLHGFGLKSAAVSKLKMMPAMASVDSMSWDFGARVKARKKGVSNTYAHRCAEMTGWMDSVSKRIKPARGDQFLLSFR